MGACWFASVVENGDSIKVLIYFLGANIVICVGVALLVTNTVSASRFWAVSSISLGLVMIVCVEPNSQRLSYLV